MQAMNKAIDEVRAEEARRLKRDGYEPVLKHSRWCLLKRRENLTEKQTVKLAELLQVQPAVGAELPAAGGLPAVLGVPVSPAGRGGSCDEWCTRTMRSKIEPMKKVARMLRSHRGADPELVPGPGDDLGGGRRRA